MASPEQRGESSRAVWFGSDSESDPSVPRNSNGIQAPRRGEEQSTNARADPQNLNVTPSMGPVKCTSRSTLSLKWYVRLRYSSTASPHGR